MPERLLRYLSHPEVVIDPETPVPDWGLSETGRARARRFAENPALDTVRRIVSSDERKARETAEILAAPRGLPVEIRADSHENDRSATGFLPPPAFQAMADQFFAEPETSADGWERAIDAQARILGAYRAVVAAPGEGDIVMVGHGGVGTLLYCALAGLPISRTHDQPGGGGGCVLTVSIAEGRPRHPWRLLEEI